MRRYANACAWAKVDQEIAAQKLSRHLLAVRNIDHHRSASLGNVLWTVDLEACVFGKLDQPRRLSYRLFSNVCHSDLIHDLEAGHRGVHPGYVRRAVQKS